MNLRHLEHLLALSETGSFSRAAERQHLTQSALSRSIQALEDELGARLVDRAGKHNELTPLGQAVAARARRMLLEAAELRRTAALLKDGDFGSIKVGLGSGPGVMLMRPFLIHMARHHPKVQVSVSPGATELQLMQLRERTLDALVIDERRLAPAPDLTLETLGEMRGGFLCRAGHPLSARAGPLPFEAIAAYPLASTPLSDEVARGLVGRFGPAADPALAVTLRCDDISSLIDVALASDAVVVCIVAAARAHLDAGRMMELDIGAPLAVAARFAMVTLAGRTEAPSLQLLRQFARERLRDGAATAGAPPA